MPRPLIGRVLRAFFVGVLEVPDALANPAAELREALGAKDHQDDEEDDDKLSHAKDKIEDALKRSAEIDARRIAVDVDGGKVTLRGSVRAWAESKAERAEQTTETSQGPRATGHQGQGPWLVSVCQV